MSKDPFKNQEAQREQRKQFWYRYCALSCKGMKKADIARRLGIRSAYLNKLVLEFAPPKETAA